MLSYMEKHPLNCIVFNNANLAFYLEVMMALRKFSINIQGGQFLCSVRNSHTVCPYAPSAGFQVMTMRNRVCRYLNRVRVLGVCGCLRHRGCVILADIEGLINKH